MTIQRYSIGMGLSGAGGQECGFDEDAQGNVVLFADHQQALSALEARIAELEKALEPITIGEWGEARHKQTVVNGFDCANIILERRRAALSPKEPAPQQSDHLKQPVCARVESGA
jgi:hypothetical protein